MKKSFKKLISVVFIVITACILFSLSAFAGGIDDKINSLRSKYPDGYYWNHLVTDYSNNGDQLFARWDESFSEHVTASPCRTHNGVASVGQYDCNFFDGGIQCFGFARRVFYDIFGVRVSNMGVRYDRENIMVGDCIRINNDTHSAVVIARNGNTLTLVEANLSLSGAAYNCRIRWGGTCSIYDVTYFHRASNYDAVNSVDWKSTLAKVDLGDDFYGAIYNNARNKVLTVETNNNNNVAMYTYTGATTQLWHFKKNSDGTYTIKNCANGLVLDVNGGVAGWANIQAYSSNGTAAQKWRFFGNSSQMFISAECNNGVLDVADAKYDEGTNLTINGKSGHDAQIFSVKKIDVIGTPSLKVGSGCNVKFSWDAVNGATSYTLYIYKNSNATGSAYITKQLTGTSVRVKLGSGNYSAVLYAHNSYAMSKSSVKTFVASHSYSTTTRKATFANSGSVKTVCTVCSSVKSNVAVKYVKSAKLSATSYVYDGKVKTPSVTVKDANGKTLKNGTDYTVKYASGRKNIGTYKVTVTLKGKYSGTKTLTFKILPGRTSKITPTATTTTLKANWNKVAGASGYKVELINSKGKVIKAATTTNLTYTFSRLSAGTTYKIRVYAYKTISGKNQYSSSSTTLTTATKPATPTIKVTSTKKGIANLFWTNVAGETGYQVYYSTNKSSGFKPVASYKTDVVKGSASKLTSKKTYYFKVRAYKKVGNTTVYGAFSSVKSVKIK